MGMVLSRVHLLHGAAHAGPVVPNHDEQILRDESRLFVRLHDLDVREPLAVRAYFVLALHDKNAAFAQDPVRFTSGVQIQVEHRFVVFAPGSIAGAVVG